jgi:hypothetical protein
MNKNALVSVIGLATGIFLVFLGTQSGSCCCCTTGGCDSFCVSEQQLYLFLIGISFIILSALGLVLSFRRITWLDKKPE